MDLPKLTDIKELVRLMKEEGVENLECGELKLRLHPSAFIKDAAPVQSQGPELKQPSEEEFDLWSSGYRPATPEEREPTE